MWESDKNRRNHNEQASPAGDQNDARNRQDSLRYTHKAQKTKMIQKRSTALERSPNKYWRALNVIEIQTSISSLTAHLACVVSPCKKFGSRSSCSTMLFDSLPERGLILK